MHRRSNRMLALWRAFFISTIEFCNDAVQTSTGFCTSFIPGYPLKDLHKPVDVLLDLVHFFAFRNSPLRMSIP